MMLRIHSAIRSEDSSRSACSCRRSGIACARCAASPLGPLPARSTSGAEHVPEAAAGAVDTLGGRGQALDTGVRSVMEARFGHDFSRVRVHADGDAARAAAALGAHAWTAGEHVVFGRGEYAPGHREGNWLLAHELAHVVQQAAAPAALSRMPAPGQASSEDAFEREASAAADRVAAGQPAALTTGRRTPMIQRASERPRVKIATAPCGLDSEKFAEIVARHAAKHQINPILTTDKVTVTCRNPQLCDVVFTKLPVTVAVRWDLRVPWVVAGWDTKTGRKACRWLYRCEEGGLVLSDTEDKCLEDNTLGPPGGPGSPPGPAPTPAPPPPPRTRPGDLIAALLAGSGQHRDFA